MYATQTQLQWPSTLWKNEKKQIFLLLNNYRNCCDVQWRARVYYRAMSFGRSPLGKLQLRLQIAMADLFQFICLIFLGVLEYFHDPKPLKIKKKAKRSDAMKKAA